MRTDKKTGGQLGPRNEWNAAGNGGGRFNALLQIPIWIRARQAASEELLTACNATEHRDDVAAKSQPPASKP
jgi:hypothetical protein